MPTIPDPEDRTDELSEALEKAAFMVINARNEAAAMLTRSGVLEPVPDYGWWGNPCGAMLPPPPQNHRCLCRNYTGDGGPCSATFIDFTGPDFWDRTSQADL